MSKKPLDRRISSRARALAAPAGLGALLLSRNGIVRAQDAATIRLTGWTSSPVEQELFEQVLEDLRAAQPDITLEYEPITGDYFTALQTEIAAGTVADVFYVNDLAAPNLMAAGQLLPLDDFMAEAASRPSDFYPGADRRIPVGRPDLRPAQGLLHPGDGLRHAGANRRRHRRLPPPGTSCGPPGETLLDATGQCRRS